MPVFEIGRIAVKTLGREAGYYCVVSDIIDQSYVLIDGPHIRRRRCNVRHLVPTPDHLPIDKGASKEGIQAAIKKAKLEANFASRIKLDL